MNPSTHQYGNCTSELDHTRENAGLLRYWITEDPLYSNVVHFQSETHVPKEDILGTVAWRTDSLSVPFTRTSIRLTIFNSSRWLSSRVRETNAQREPL